MHTLKIGWAGQTYALAKCNELNSGGKKSRIRRSKEERKAMVESFIKMYQNKNNGNFPSLNLTHKEVGGSFYTVREIVREIIQENRVLGPAKFIPREKRSSDQFSQEYHLDLIAVEPQIPFVMPSEETQPDLLSSLNNGDGDELVDLSEEMHNAGKELQIINGSEEDLNDESVLRAEAGVVIDQSVMSTFKVIDLTNVEVETFPMNTITKGEDCLYTTVGKSTVSSETLNEKQNANVSSALANDDSQPYGLSSQEESAPKDDKVKENQTKLLVYAAKSTSIEESKVAQNPPDPLIESSDRLMTKEGSIQHIENGKSLINKESRNDALSSEGPKDNKEGAPVQAINEPNGVPGKSLNGALQRTDAQKPFQGTEFNPEPDRSSNWSIPKERNPTLDRISLSETWEASSRTEINPLVAIFKSFVASFIKFWSE